jgi:hypothetical protein
MWKYPCDLRKKELERLARRLKEPATQDYCPCQRPGTATTKDLIKWFHRQVLRRKSTLYWQFEFADMLRNEVMRTPTETIDLVKDALRITRGQAKRLFEDGRRIHRLFRIIGRDKLANVERLTSPQLSHLRDSEVDYLIEEVRGH